MASKNKSNKNKTNTKPKHPEKIVDSKAIPSDDANCKFEVELLWCIQQLESLLATNSLNPAKAKESIKALNILKNNSQPIIKKRQIMNLTFGDYRAKMAEEEKKFSKVTQQIKFKSKPNKTSVFIKKSALQSGPDNFKFNFTLSEEDKIDDKTTEAVKEKANEDFVEANKNIFKFTPSENAFRFNFDINESMNV